MQYINVNGKLMDFSQPQIMGIINITPDSFFVNSRAQTEKEIISQAQQMIKEGANILDIGAYSSRPGAKDVTPEEESERLHRSLGIIRKEFPDAILSVDTFRADIAKMSVEEYGVDIINDISAGELDKNMFKTISELKVPYIMMHMKGTPQNMQQKIEYQDLIKDIFLYFSKKIDQLHLLGVNDIIIDPGFGFSKSVEQNYELMNHLKEYRIFDLPILVGISRKSMIYKLLNNSPQEALNGTSILNTIAVNKGANILRVHDVKEAKEVVTIYNQLKKY